MREAGKKALADAKIDYSLIEQACVGYGTLRRFGCACDTRWYTFRHVTRCVCTTWLAVYGDSTSGNRAVYELGLSGVPVFNTNNNCSTGSTALMMAQQFVAGGMSDCVLAVGFEKMQRGSLAIGSEVCRPLPGRVACGAVASLLASPTCAGP